MKVSIFTLSFLLCLLLAACSKREQAAATGFSANAPKSVSVVGSGAAENATPPPPGAAPSSPVQAASEGSPAPAAEPEAVPMEHEAVQLVLNASRDFFADKQRYARDLDELIRAGYLKKKPLAPKGRKYVFSPNDFTVRLVNE